MTSRRYFLRIAGGALLAPASISGKQREKSDIGPLVDQVPPMLDHILLGCNDFERGIDFVEQHTGVRAAFGGVHPGRGTQNALLSLGASTGNQKGRYLEIIAQDRLQHTDNPLVKRLKELPEPRLVGWAAHPGDVQVLANDIAKAGIAAVGPTPGSRKRPDGKMLHWKTLHLKDDANGLLPFFIEWGADSIHPSEDAPAGCQLLRFELLTPDPASLAKATAKLMLTTPIGKSTLPELHAVIAGPGGTLDVTS